MVGLARLPIGQAAGWGGTSLPTRLDGVTTDTVVLPSMAAAAPSLPRPRTRLGQLGVDTGYVLLGSRSGSPPSSSPSPAWPQARACSSSGSASPSSA